MVIFNSCCICSTKRCLQEPVSSVLHPLQRRPLRHWGLVLHRQLRGLPHMQARHRPPAVRYDPSVQGVKFGKFRIGSMRTLEHWRWLENSFILEFLFKSQSRRACDSCWWKKRCFMLRVWPTCNRFFWPHSVRISSSLIVFGLWSVLWSWWRNRRPTEFWS